MKIIKLNQINRLLLMAIFNFQLLTVSSQIVFSLDNCKVMALKNNVKMQNAVADIHIAEEQKKEAFTKFFPQISSSAMAFNLNKPLINMQSSETDFSLLKNGYSVMITAMQPIYAGGQIVNGNKLAGLEVESKNLQQKISQNDVILTTEQYYWQLVSMQEKMKTIAAVKSMLKSLEHEVETSVKAGVKLRNELLQVQLRLNELNANECEIENTMKLSHMLLAQYIGLKDTTFSVVDSVSSDIPEFPIKLKRDGNEAVLATSEYRLLQIGEKSSIFEHRLELGKNLPTVSVGAGWTHGLTDKYYTNRSVVMASVSIPISGWWGGSHAIKRSQIAVQKSQNDLRDGRERLVIRIQTAWNDVENAYRQMSIAHESIVQAQENLRLNSNYYRAGTSKMSDLLDAQMLYQQARDKYVDSHIHFTTKILEYKQNIGE